VYLVRACRRYPSRAVARKPGGIAAARLFAADRGKWCDSAAIAIVDTWAIADNRAIANAWAIADARASAGDINLWHGDEQYQP
jgi:hypothetical protein